MTWLWIATWAALQAPAPQETPVPEPAKLLEELQKKFDALGGVSGKLNLYSIDPKGDRTLRFKGTFHIRLTEGWVYLEVENLEKKTGVGCVLFDGIKHMLAWQEGKAGTRLDMDGILRELWKHTWRFDQEQAKVLEGPEISKTLDEHIAKLRHELFFQIEPAMAGAPDPANFRFVMGKSKKGGVSWLKPLTRDYMVAATPDEIIVSEQKPVRVTRVDRFTGFLRSVRIDLATADSRLLEITEVASKAAKPEIHFPERWTDRPARLGDQISMIAPALKSMATGCLDNLLKEWASVGADDRAERLRAFFAWIGAEMDALNREAMRLQWAAGIIKQVVDQGGSIDELRRDMDAQAKQLGERLREAEGNSKGERMFVERLIALRKDLEKGVEAAPGSDEAKKFLIQRIREGFEPDRLRKAVPSRPAPDYVRILRETLDMLQEKESK